MFSMSNLRETGHERFALDEVYGSVSLYENIVTLNVTRPRINHIGETCDDNICIKYNTTTGKYSYEDEVTSMAGICKQLKQLYFTEDTFRYIIVAMTLLKRLQKG